MNKDFGIYNDNISDEEILLCDQCETYLTNRNNKVAMTYEKTWPSFYWYMICSNDINACYGVRIWELIPTRWRLWWLPAIQNIPNYESVTIDFPKPIIVDRTESLRKWKENIECGSLGSLKEVCNEILIPTVLCPWGCTEYSHQYGSFPIDLLLQHHMRKCRWQMMSTMKNISLIESSRNDFLRDDVEYYEKILFNPKWKVLPSIVFNEKGAPVIMTCRTHDKGTKKKYLHPPRQPNHNLACIYGDQLAHAVIKPRSIKPMKATKYVNTYQMHQQQGSFQGIDTCDVTNYGDFSKTSVILDENESRTIISRQDINVLLTDLQKNKVISSFTANGLRKRAKEACPSPDILQSHSDGSTFIGAEDSMKIQMTISEEQDIKIALDVDTSDEESIPENETAMVICRRNWPQFIIFSQVVDSNGYGCHFPMIPHFNKNNTAGRILWSLSEMLTKIPILWELTDQCTHRLSQWNGWLLSYLSSRSFPSMTIRCDRRNPFKKTFTRKLDDLVKKMKIDFVDTYDFETMSLLFENHTTVKVTDTIPSQNINSLPSHDVLIIVPRITISVPFCKQFDYGDCKYKLRHVSMIWEQPRGWNGRIYSRHGSPSYNRWWLCEKNKSLSIKYPHEHLSNIEWSNVHSLVYVKKYSTSFEQSRKDFMRYIGGQSHVVCHKHKLPLIVTKKKERTCCFKVDEPLCRHFSYYRCPEEICSVNICKHCFKSCNRDQTTSIKPRNESELNLDEESSILNDSDEENSTQSNESIISMNSSNSSDNKNRIITNDYNDENMLFPYEIQNDELDEFVVTSEITDISEEDIIPESLPTTNAGEVAFTIEEEIPKGMYIGNHVILNQCGSLLSRKDSTIEGYKYQKHFLQRIVSTSSGTSIPLLYPEAMLFPSIFWKQLTNCGSIPGAIPSGLLTQNQSTFGFESIKTMVHTRSLSASSPTSTKPAYISFNFDLLSNLACNRTHSKLIINRGLMCATNDTGLQIHGKNDSYLSGSMDSKMLVRNLCASQEFHKMTYFLTFTCNQATHFGVQVIKNWINSGEWKKHYPNWNKLKKHEQEEVENAVIQSSAGLLLRQWLEVKKLFINYLYSSPSSPYCPVDSIFVRDEFQSEQGNLFHIHLMLSIKMDLLDDVQREKIQGLIRASIADIVHIDEMEDFINDDILKSWEDVYDVRKLGQKNLSHKCSQRCQMRIGPGDGPENFKCRKLNNMTVNPNYTKDFFLELVKSRNSECVRRLIKVGLADPININKHGVASDFKCSQHIFHPSRHIPPSNPNDDVNMSPVEPKTFCACKSMQNIQFLHHTNGCNKYCCKYCVKVDKSNVVDIKTNHKSPASLVNKETFLHNTKIVRSAMNEEKARDKKRLNKKPTGRAIALTEMLHTILGEKEVHTDMNFISVCTLPLEFRSGYESTKKQSFYLKDLEQEGYQQNDGDNSGYICDEIRKDLELEDWRQHTEQELMILKGVISVNITVDLISLFSLRPPEIRSLIDQPGIYFRWFFVTKKTLSYENMEKVLDRSFENCAWVDALQHQVFVRDKAFDEIESFINKNGSLTDPNISVRLAAKHLSFIIGQHKLYYSQEPENVDKESIEVWKYIEKNFIYKEEKKHLPVPVYSFVKPSHNIKFLLHVLLSMGHFATELDITLCSSFRDAFAYAKLIGSARDDTSLEKYSDNLLFMFITKQLKYYPCSYLQMERWVIIAADLFDSVIRRDEISISDIPPALQTSLDTSYDERVIKAFNEMKQTLIQSAFRELGSNIQLYSTPTYDDLMQCKRDDPINWPAVERYVKGSSQTEESFSEQKSVIKYAVNTIDHYLDSSRQTTFVKNMVITGAPGSGKTYVMNYIVLYAISRGLKVGITASMSQRAVQIGGTHIHKLFGIPVNNKLTLHSLAENAIATLLRNPTKLQVLRELNILFLDEIGQLSTEMIALLNKILQYIRGNNIFMGGLLIISTLDHKQLQPVSGRPFLVSAYIISCFRFVILKHSVCAAGDPAFQRIQNIARIHPKMYSSDPMLLQELAELIKSNCTFVNSWNSPEICPGVFRLYGKKYPAKQASHEYITSVKMQLNQEEYVERISEDIQKRNDSHQEWCQASEHTMSTLDNQLKEQRTLLFFKGALYQFTFNKENKFSQSQLGLLLKIPSREDLSLFRKIEILVAPPGMKWTMYNMTKSEADYINNGWSKQMVGLPPDRSHKISHNVQGKRRQYGLKHHVTSTIHSSMGDTLPKVATQISNQLSIFKLWDKAQIVVLLSRTKRARDIIFVGNKESTVRAIVELCKCSNQWTDHMERVLEMANVNYASMTNSTIPSIRNDDHPFRFCDRPLPNCNTGIVYMLISVRNHNYTYIGMTSNIAVRLQQHNSGNGHAFTTPTRLRPWALFAYITGFDGDRRKMFSIERRWKTRRQEERERGISCPKQIARLGNGLIESNQSNTSFAYKHTDLRLTLNFSD